MRLKVVRSVLVLDRRLIVGLRCEDFNGSAFDVELDKIRFNNVDLVKKLPKVDLIEYGEILASQLEIDYNTFAYNGSSDVELVRLVEEDLSRLESEESERLELKRKEDEEEQLSKLRKRNEEYQSVLKQQREETDKFMRRNQENNNNTMRESQNSFNNVINTIGGFDY